MVAAVAVGDAGRIVASGGVDGMVPTWDRETGDARRILRGKRRYEGLDITDLTGVTEAEREALLALGALDRHAGPLVAQEV